ncbi:1-aminocyclopropane-1-carboxylate deaminase [Chitinophaga sp. CF118]|uniref:1-aminocyclopropane-1-carboxylate deaminase/D-cysteine desulfhydrase n=1 Tax=Chitinophaga sp. CF118 TaxID=1884367 RepID=UPI0008F284FD|nr:pyridoxal-phosphate dependent enzyme [Chitinophaga sp. CF118]SFE13601.1 1-aminocyclopropane-1-carboxylate deaminase [Chitinophaga sp. CF118]
MEVDYRNIILQNITPSWLPDNIQAAMLRLDLLHPEISGNKWFKLKYNLEAAGKRRILTFGGAYSNHIAATAAACELAGLPCIGIIRGERPLQLSHTLQLAVEKGMQLEFVSREVYRHKDSTNWTPLFPDAYIIPEGGNNVAGARGCQEILSLADTSAFTHILCAVGTGTTLAGLISSAQPHQLVQGYVVLKGATYLQEEVAALLRGIADLQGSVFHAAPWTLIHDFHGGGYAKTSSGLISFINHFYQETRIPLDVVYTGKLVWGFSQSAFPAGSKILLIHTGGLQGNLSLSPDVLNF